MPHKRNGHIDGTMPYKKQKNKKTPAKAGHRHEYAPCVIASHGIMLDKAHGFVQGPLSYTIQSCCTVCGKLGPMPGPDWFRWVPSGPGSAAGRSEYTAKAKREFDPATRVLPAFYVDDPLQRKFVGKPDEGRLAELESGHGQEYKE